MKAYYSSGKGSLAVAATAVSQADGDGAGHAGVSVCRPRLAMTTILRNRDGAVKQCVPIINVNL